jgi:hypothetical protein
MPSVLNDASLALNASSRSARLGGFLSERQPALAFCLFELFK